MKNGSRYGMSVSLVSATPCGWFHPSKWKWNLDLLKKAMTNEYFDIIKKVVMRRDSQDRII